MPQKLVEQRKQLREVIETLQQSRLTISQTIQTLERISNLLSTLKRDVDNVTEAENMAEVVQLPEAIRTTKFFPPQHTDHTKKYLNTIPLNEKIEEEVKINILEEPTEHTLLLPH